MPLTLYSTTCFIKNDLYRLHIYVNDDDDDKKNSTDTQLSSFTSTDISKESIKPSLTQIKFQLINEKKNTNTSKIIILNQLLNVQQTKIITKKTRRNFNISTEVLNTYGTITPIVEQSKQTSCTTLNTQISEIVVPQTPIISRQFSFGRFFSTQSNPDDKLNPTYKSIVKINYVDISNSIRWNIKRLEVEVETEDIANELYMNLNLCLSTLTQRPQNLLVFINPFGGKGRAPYVYEKQVLPIFKESNINVKGIYTERANHAHDYILNEDLSGYDGLICVGGDGMFAELCHGLLLRTSHEAHLDIHDRQVNLIRPDLKIGVIPAGSTDAVVFGTTGLNDPITSALQIIVGESLLIDIATVHNEKGFVRFMATMLAYGFFGDIIHQSDKWRCLGPLRYDLAGFCQFISNKSYHTELTITLASSSDSTQICQPGTVTLMNNTNNETTSSSIPPLTQTKDTINSTTNTSNKVLDKIVTPGLEFCRRNCEQCALVDKPHTDKVQSPLQIKCEGRYTTINCLNMPGRCAKSKFGMSPYVHLGDGTFDLILVKRSWFTGFLRFLIQVASDGRTIEDLHNVERHRVSEVLIRPMHTDQIRLGNWACDGEVISGNEIKIRIHRQVLNLFASGIQFDNVRTNNPIKEVKTN
ncbi:unnamed protein product [Adineta steineri]|uniref:DAGKc domain-containing protein n=1 Tax=Adineta steineri TaxID=433720 RepID=A0A814A9X0_9BILA|nr:unnamed protein product [Adineta steineri]CAF0910566.1 unnamed protein product [Adineta steineri]